MPIYYRTHESGLDYGFDFVWAVTTWRIDIVSQPSYQGRSEGMHATHRLGQPGHWYICWTDPIRRLKDAKTIAGNWAEATDRYIRTGDTAWAFSQPLITDFGEDGRAAATFARLEREVSQ